MSGNKDNMDLEQSNSKLKMGIYKCSLFRFALKENEKVEFGS